MSEILFVCLPSSLFFRLSDTTLLCVIGVLRHAPRVVEKRSGLRKGFPVADRRACHMFTSHVPPVSLQLTVLSVCISSYLALLILRICYPIFELPPVCPRARHRAGRQRPAVPQATQPSRRKEGHSCASTSSSDIFHP